jgi:hypothetical protein
MASLSKTNELTVYYNITIQHVKKPRNTISYSINSHIVEGCKSGTSPKKLTLSDSYDPRTAESNIKNIMSDLNYTMLIGNLSQQLYESDINISSLVIIKFAEHNWKLIPELLIITLNQILFNVYVAKVS